MIKIKYKATSELVKKANKQLYLKTKTFKFRVLITLLYSLFVFMAIPPITLTNLMIDIVFITIVIIIIVLIRKLRLKKLLKDFEPVDIELNINKEYFILQTSENENLKIKTKKITEIKETKDFIYLIQHKIKRLIPKSAINSNQIKELKTLIEETK